VSLDDYEGDQSGGDIPDGEVFAYEPCDCKAKGRVASCETVSYTQKGDPGARVDATLLAGSTISRKHSAKNQSKGVTKQREKIFGAPDEYAPKPSAGPVFEVEKDWPLGVVSPSHITGVIGGTNANGSDSLICLTDPYAGVPIGVLYASKHLTELLGEKLGPDDFEARRSDYQEELGKGETESGFEAWVQNAYKQGTSEIEEMGTIASPIPTTGLQTDTTAAAGFNWTWSPVLYPTKDNAEDWSRFLLRFHSKKVPLDTVKSETHAFYLSTGGKTEILKDFTKSQWSSVKHWGLWIYREDTGVFLLTPIGKMLASGECDYSVYIRSFCARYQFPNGFNAREPGVHLKPMVEFIKALKKLGKSGEEQEYLSKEEQHGFIQDVATGGDVEGFVSSVLASRTTGDVPDHWKEKVGSAFPHRAMEIVRKALGYAQAVSTDSEGNTRLSQW